MEVKNELCKVIEALTELEHEYTRPYLINFLLGRETKDIVSNGHQELETFGIGKGDGGEDEEELYTNIIHKATAEGLLVKTEEGLSITPAAKKFLRKPTSFVLEEDGEDKDNAPDHESDDLDSLLKDADLESARKNSAKGKSAMKIKLIKAIDHKLPLDDFAIDEDIEFSEVLDELESIILSGTKIKFDYFIEMLLDEDQIDEINEFIAENANIKQVIEHFENQYDEEVIRLVYINNIANRLKKK